MTIFQQSIALFSQPPGSLIYHVGILFALEAALAIGLGYRQRPGSRRVVVASAVMLLARLALVLVALLAWRGLIGNSDLFLPPLERAADTVGTWMLVWALLPLFEIRPQWSDLIAGVVTLLLIALYVFFASSWGANQQLAALGYNSSQQEAVWEVLQLALLGTACVYTLIDRQGDWGLHLGLLLVLLGVHILHFSGVQAGGNVAGWERLGQLVAYPLFAVSAFRSVLAGATTAPPPAEAQTISLTESQQTKLLCAITATLDESIVAQAATNALAVIADTEAAALLLAPLGQPDLEQLTEMDLVAISTHDHDARPFQRKVALGDAPALRRVIRDHQPILLQSGDADDPSRLALLMRIAPETGVKEQLATPLLVLPLPEQAQTLGALLIQPAGTGKEWPDKDRSLFDMIIAQLAVGLAHARALQQLQNRFSSLQAQFQSPEPKVSSLKAQLNQARQLERELTTQLETARQDSLSGQRLAEERTAEAENQEARIRALQKQVEKLETELNQEHRPTEPDTPSTLVQEQVESLAEELRQPVASISGYTDLLLGGSVGSVGDLQERLLQRIKASAVRAGVLLDDLVYALTARLTGRTLQIEAVNVRQAVDAVLAEFSAGLAEKNLDLQLHIDDSPSLLEVDQKSLGQIINQLLANAIRVSHPGELVRLEMHYQSDDSDPEPGGRDKGYLFIAITDSGGGISTAQQAHVFDRLYRSEHPDIEGLNDQGVGLPLVHELVQAHGGRIWIESDPNTSSTFSLVLPTRAVKDV